MSYTKTTWTDEVLAGAERFTILDNAGAAVDDVNDLANCQITLATSVTTEGTPVNAANLNNMENGIAALDTHLNALDSDADNIAEHADVADAVPWSGITGKPTGLMYYPIAEQYLYNTSTIAVGIHDFNLTSYGVPANAKAVYMRLRAKWAAASSGSYIALLPKSGLNNYGSVIRAMVADMRSDGSGIVRTDESINSAVSVKVVGAEALEASVIVQGYFL